MPRTTSSTPRSSRGGEATRTKTCLDDSKTQPLLTQPTSKYPPLVDAPDAPDSPPTLTREYASNITHLASKSNLPGDRLTAADDILFEIYQDWVHQNPGTYLDGGIEEDGEWKKRWEKILFLPTQRYDVQYGWIGKRFVETLVVEIYRIQN